MLTPLLEIQADLAAEDHIVDLVDQHLIHQMVLILDLQFTEIMVTLDQVINNLVLVEVLVELVRQHQIQENLVDQDYKFHNLLYLECQQCLMVQVLVIGLLVADLIRVLLDLLEKDNQTVLQDIPRLVEQTLEMVLVDNHLLLLVEMALL